ncbi:Protein of unknown function [Tistlia consotensis]|uniref:DUF1674 domain-containing protein n=1 Tax=Tistlia consotensis USBA 355 TaxID=560819 RepID=A0A1Y6CU72_9PROT|nr:succinate dehydrogenase assembly factor 4 [Tistlia consotensis]SMF78280.1 Protein of unknown function [Tistlia consotensis USBA 355]SNS18205.1 Protein of unknown function [Tistlia consotensis]
MSLFKSHRPKTLPPVRKPAQPVSPPATVAASQAPAAGKAGASAPARPKELGGPEGPEPTRYGDWERKGICYDF